MPEAGRVLVTGAAGRLGRAVIADLAETGWDVLAVDRTRPTGWTGEFCAAELTDAAVLGYQPTHSSRTQI